jgi:CubicO group peptidase (beta-lactamase class C family)
MPPTTILKNTARAAAGIAVAGLLVGVAAVPAAAATPAPLRTGAAPTELPYGPDTCKVPFVWREARPDDHVCVSVDTRTQTQQENAAAPSRVEPGKNGFGPNACRAPFVWREAFDGDAVCVPVERRTQAKDDNAHAAERRATDTAAKVQDRLGTALSDWMDRNGVANASMAVMRDNELVGEFDKGEQGGAEAPAPVASLSKAITAVGVMSLIDNGRLQFGTTLSALPQDFQDSTGVSAHLDTVGAITIEQLLRHRSGITFDPVNMGRFGQVPQDDTADLALIRLALDQPRGPVGTEAYNNVNYAILGRVIAAVSGENYESYVQRMVLAPRGAPTAHIGAGLRALGAFGGWEISPVEYAMFGRSFDRRANLLSPAAHRFLDDMTSKDHETYALGVGVQQTATGGRDVWHFGAWSSDLTTPHQFGSYFEMWDNGIAVAVAFDRFPTDAMENSLRAALQAAAASRP